MNAFLNVVIGIGIALAGVIIAWLAKELLFSPRVRVTDMPGEEDKQMRQYRVRISSRLNWRSLTDVNVMCSLHIPLNGKGNILALDGSSDSIPIIERGDFRVITISMDPESLTMQGREILRGRLAQLQVQPNHTPSLFDIFDLVPKAYIEVAVTSTDPISKMSRTSSERLKPHTHQS